MDGLTLAREIRRYNKTMPLVMLTFLGQNVESDLFEANLTKPIKLAQFYNIIIDVLTPPPIVAPLLTPEVILASRAMRILLAEDKQYVTVCQYSSFSYVLLPKTPKPHHAFNY